MAFTIPITVSTTDFVDDNDVNPAFVEDREFLHKSPFAHVYRASTQSIPHNTATSINFDAEYYDTDGVHDTVTNNHQLIVQTGGMYAISGVARFASAAGTSIRQIRITVNGSFNIAINRQRVSGINCDMNVSVVYPLAVNDTVEMQVFQDSGSALNVQYLANLPPQLSMQWLGAGTA